MTSKQSAPLVARIVHPDTPATVAPARVPLRTRMARKVSTVLIGLFVVFLSTMGVGAGTQPAAAWDPLDGVKKWASGFVCMYSSTPPNPNNASSDDAVFGPRAPFDSNYQNRSMTAYEEFGFTGLNWTEYRAQEKSKNPGKRDGCVFKDNNFGQWVGNYTANQIFSVNRGVTGLTVAMYTWATNPKLLKDFTTPMVCVVKGCHGGKGLKDTLYLNYLAPIVMLGALWGAWNGLVKKRTTETTQGGLWMVGATAFALIFMAQPGFIANQTNAFINQINTSITNSVTNATSSTLGKKDMCWVQGQQAGNRMAACSIWKAMVFTPWSAGQFGVPGHVPLKASTTANVGNRDHFDDMRIVQLDAQTLSRSEQARIDAGASYDSIEDADNTRWKSIRSDLAGGKTKASYSAWAGEQYGDRVQIALSGLIAALCLGILVILISFSTVVMAVGMILLIMLAPIFLLIGVHPGFGRGIALKWLELLLGTVLKRILLTTMLGILVGLYQIILETPGLPWFSQVALVMAVGVGALIFRKPMLETLNVINLGGSRTGMENGLDQQVKQGAGAAAGALGGGVGAVLAGGGAGAMVGGMVKGGTMGSRSGSPTRAASMGAASGRRVGGGAAAKKRTEQQELHEAGEKAKKNLEERIGNDPHDPDTLKDVRKHNKKYKRFPDLNIKTPRAQGDAEQVGDPYDPSSTHGAPGDGGSGSGAGAGPRPTPRPQPRAGQQPAPQPAPQPGPGAQTAPEQGRHSGQPQPQPHSGQPQPGPQPSAQPRPEPAPQPRPEPAPQPASQAAPQPGAQAGAQPGSPTGGGLPVSPFNFRSGGSGGQSGNPPRPTESGS